jgi:integrase
MAMGRPQKPYHTSWGDLLPGLYRCPDGRWRINATGQKFTEPDERRAVQKFLDWTAKHNPAPTVEMVGDFNAGLKPVEPMGVANGVQLPIGYVEGFSEGPMPDGIEPELRTGYSLPQSVIWPWLREQLITRPEHVAKMIGIPELAGLRHFSLPTPSLKLEHLIEVYRQNSPSSEQSKTRCVRVFRRLMEHADARTLDDLTTEKLLALRHSIENDPALKSSGTKTWMYGQVKTLIAFGLDVGLEASQIAAALARCSVLWTPDPLPDLAPNPTSRTDFHKLLTATGNGPWRAWLLVGLNFCMHMDEVCGIQTKDMDVAAGTYACIRNKTRRQRVPRAAVLWPETMDAVRPLLGKQLLFTSPTGTRYNVRSRCNEFAKLRAKAGLPNTVTFDGLRDAAFGAACKARENSDWAKVLAGQRAAGQEDNYVLRNPACVRPACDAVYASYGPFPTVETNAERR